MPRGQTWANAALAYTSHKDFKCHVHKLKKEEEELKNYG